MLSFSSFLCVAVVVVVAVVVIFGIDFSQLASCYASLISSFGGVASSLHE